MFPVSLESLVTQLYPVDRAQIVLQVLKSLGLDLGAETIATSESIIDPVVQLEITNQDTKQVKAVLPGNYSIGSDSSCMIALNDRWVSRFHCVLRVHSSGTVEIADINSKNGVQIDEEPIPSNKWVSLVKDEVVRVGKSFLVVLPIAPATDK